MPSWFFAREGARLLGALSIFAPRLDEAEIGAAVLPGARRKGVFSAMQSSARRELLRFGYLDELFVVDGGSAAGKAVAEGLGARREFTEYAMRYSGTPRGKAAPGLELKRLGVEWLEELVELRLGEFGDSREEAEGFERATFAAPDRQSYGAFVDGRLIGACSLGFEDKTVSINGLVVATAERGKGYGQAILGELIMMLAGGGLELILDVNSLNANALHIYEKVGFVPTMTKEYWRRRLPGGAAAALLRELGEYRPAHPGEETAVDHIAAFVSSRPDAFSRSCLEGHVTGSAFVADSRLERALFAHHAKSARWLQGGAHCDAGESAREAASRETLEETGIRPEPFPGLGIFDVDVREIPACEEAPAHFHCDIRYLFKAQAVGARASEESLALEWLGFGEAVSRNPDQSIRRPLAKLDALRKRGDSRC